MLLIGATASRSYAELAEDALMVKFGAYEETFPYHEIKSCRKRGWKLIYGIGTRYAPDDTVGFIGSRKGVVELLLKEEREFAILLTVPATRFAFSLQDPDGFLSELQSRLPSDPPDD